MATSYGALCTDFYVNHKVTLKMDLPGDRETILHLFDQVRRAVPSMERFRRYHNELALESSKREAAYRWLGLRRRSIRTGHVNPDTMEQTYDYHRMVLKVAPFHLTVSPLDIDYLELLFGFDLECKSDHDAVVHEALFADSPLGDLFQVPHAKTLDVQPVFGLSLSKSGDMQCYFEVKTRTKNRRGSSARYRNEPISIFLSLRRYGPVDRIEDLPKLFNQMAGQAEKLASDKLVPNLVTPISRRITSTP